MKLYPVADKTAINYWPSSIPAKPRKWPVYVTKERDNTNSKAFKSQNNGQLRNIMSRVRHEDVDKLLRRLQEEIPRFIKNLLSIQDILDYLRGEDS